MRRAAAICLQAALPELMIERDQRAIDFIISDAQIMIPVGEATEPAIGFACPISADAAVIIAVEEA